jgi:hypothetical protein
MTNARAIRNAAIRGYFGPPGSRRRGRHQIAIRRALACYAAMLTTRELFEHVYPGCADRSEWRWSVIRRAAERFATRVTPRSRPLRWRLK